MTKTRKAPASAGKPTMLRAATVRSQSFDPKAKTVDIVWTTGAAVERIGWDGDHVEVLSLAPGAVRLDRLNMGAPFLNTHASWSLEDVIGSVVPNSARIEDGKGIATIVLSGGAADEGTVGKIRDGIVRNISVGYLIHSFTDTTKDGVTTRLVTDWEPLEISAVPIPADPGAQIRSHGRRRQKPTRTAPLPAPKPVSARVADIKRWAAKAGMRSFGALHIRSGTTSDDFFWLLAERLNGTRKAETMSTSKTKDEREFEAGRRAAERIMGRSSKRDDEEKNDEDKDDDEDDRDETCPTCGQTIEDDEDHNDGDADDAADDEGRDDDTDDDRKRSLRSGRRVHASAAHRDRIAPSRPQERNATAPTPHRGLNLDRRDMERGALAFRKLTNKG